MNVRRVLTTALGVFAIAGLAAAVPARSADRPVVTPPWESAVVRPLHAHAALVLGGARHTLELWRDGKRFRRDTDGGRLLSIGSDEDVVLLQPARDLAIRTGRGGLAHLGDVGGWSALTTLAGRRPGAKVFLEGRCEEKTPAGSCRWYRIERQGELCWSAEWSLALLSRETSGATLEVTAVEPGNQEPALFLVPGGIALVDADSEIMGGE